MKPTIFNSRIPAIHMLRLPRTLAVSCLLAVSLLFQSTPAGHAAAAVNSRIVAAPIGNLNPDQKIGPIRMSNMTVLQTIDLLREFSGRVILPGEGLPDLKLNFNSGGPLARKDAIFALENLLAMNGVHLRLMDEGFVAVTPSANVERNAPVLLTDWPDATESNQIYSKLFQLQNVSENIAFQRVRNLLSTRNRSGVQRLPEANALLITDTLSNLRRVDELLRVLDQPAATRHELYTFQIEHGNAVGVRHQLLLALRSGLASHLSETMIQADTQSNTLWLVTHPSNFEFFNKLIQDFDQEIIPFTTTEVVPIERGNFWTIWGAVNGIIRAQQLHYRQRSFRSRETTLSAAARRLTEEDNQPGESASGESGDGDTLAVQEATPSSDPSAVMLEEADPELQFSPYIALFSDPPNNSIVVYGTRADIRRIRALIAQLDIRSAPYITTESIPVVHAEADDLRNIIAWTVATQQRTFRQALISDAGRTEHSRSEIEGSYEFSSFAAVISNRRDNSLLVHGTQQDLDRIRDLVEKLDVEAVPLTRNEVVYLEHAEAAALGRMVQSIIQFQRVAFARQRTQSQTRTEENAPPLGDQPSLGFEFSPYAVVNADRRTNALFLYGTAQDIARVRQIVGEADIPVEPTTTTRILPLTHTDANQTAAIINRLTAGQSRALARVRSETRGIRNPVADGADTPSAGLIEGEESLQFSPFISVTPDNRSNSLIVYGTHGDIRQVQTLLREVDIEVAPFTRSEVFFLENTQANILFPVLSRVVQQQELSLRRVRSSIMEIRNIRPDDPAGEGVEMALQGLQFSPYVTITPNNRNNTIIVFGTEGDIRQLAQLIEASDIKTAPRTRSRTFSIRHANAPDVARTITALIGQQQRVREREATLTRVFRRNGDSPDGQDREEELPENEAARFGSLIEETSTTNYADLYSYDEDLQFSPYISLVADTRSNSVLAYGTTFDLEQVAHLIEQIDKVLTQVRIEVIIAEVTLSGNQVSGLESFGINYRNPLNFQQNATVPGDIGISGTGPGLDRDGRPVMDFGLALSDFSLTSVFRVAQQDNKVKVLSAPSITTSHNQLATINVGEARPVITSLSSNLASSNLVTRSEIQFRDIGITLRVRPLVGEDSFIQMDLEQIVETVIDTQTIDGNVQPIIGTRRAQSFVSVRDREVLVMGGLQSVDSSNREGRMALLGHIPVLGNLFRPKQQGETVRELVIFIQPYVVESRPRDQVLRQENLEQSMIGESVDHFMKQGRFFEIETRTEVPSPTPTSTSDLTEEAREPVGLRPVGPEAADEGGLLREVPPTPEPPPEREAALPALVPADSPPGGPPPSARRISRGPGR